jgi:hypothetical protein
MSTHYPWKYEEEVRFWGPLENEENGLYFVLFDENALRLVEVIIGAKSYVKKTEIVDALGPLAKQVTIRKARAAYDEFEMTEDEEPAK